MICFPKKLDIDTNNTYTNNNNNIKNNNNNDINIKNNNNNDNNIKNKTSSDWNNFKQSLHESSSDDMKQQINTIDSFFGGNISYSEMRRRCG